MQILVIQGDETEDMIYSSVPHYSSGRRGFGGAPNFRMVVSHIREKVCSNDFPSFEFWKW